VRKLSADTDSTYKQLFKLLQSQLSNSPSKLDVSPGSPGSHSGNDAFGFPHLFSLKPGTEENESATLEMESLTQIVHI
jgi:hypothetical protein